MRTSTSFRPIPSNDMSNSSNSSSGGTGFFGLLTLLFIGLKLGGVIDWSWWLVLMPFWGGLAIALFFAAIYFSLVAVQVARNKKNMARSPRNKSNW
jgi:hypothetical protein